MSGGEALKLTNIGKEYPLVGSAGSVTALRSVTLDVSSGTATSIIGPNGAGKSTLLKIAAGITLPSAGNVQRDRGCTALIELGLAFEPELTGLENIDIGLALFGVGRRSLSARRRRIIEFAELARSIHRPVRQFSDGMRARLAIAVALETEPDLLLIDEVLGVGDHNFRRRAVERVGELVRGGAAVVLVTHDMLLARIATSTCVWMDHGRVVTTGPTAAVIDKYLQAMESGRTISPDRTTLVRRVRATPEPVSHGGHVDVELELHRDPGATDFRLLLETLPPIGDDVWWMRGEELPPSLRMVSVLGSSSPIPIRGLGTGECRLRVRVPFLPPTPPGVELAVVLLEMDADAVIDEARCEVLIEGDPEDLPLVLTVDVDGTRP